MPRDGKETPLPPSFVQRAVEGLRYIISGVTPSTWFGPAQPLQPMAPAEVAGRQFDYPVGYNLTVTPRADEGVSFAQLRSLADSYDLLRLVIETRKDQMERLQWTIRRRALTNGRSIDRDDDPRIGEIETFFRMPDAVHFWSTWLRQLLEDLFVIDAPTLYLRRSRNGQLYALEPVDGSTIKRLIDIDGRTPTPPDPAYQQVLHGVPAVDYTTQELIYRPRNARTHKLYGFSPVEQIVMTVNIALRRQLHQLAYYTEGNVPEALIGTPESWTPSQIKEFQQYWDALLEGNLAQRRHAKFVPGGVAKTFIPTKETELKSAFDEWLARIVCFAFSVSPQPFTDHVNRATAETAQAAALAEGLAPIQNWVKQLVDYLLITEFDAPDLEFAWRDEREIDAAKLAGVAQIYVTHGIKTVNEARADIGLDPVAGGDTPMVFTGTGAMPLAQAANGGGGAPAGGAAAKALAKYSPDQPRDERGRWTSDGATGTGSAPSAMQVAQAQPAIASDGDRPLVPVAGSEESEGGRGRSFIEDEFLDPTAPVRELSYQRAITRLRAIDPANRDAVTLQSPQSVPSAQDVQRVRDALDTAIENVSRQAAEHSYDKHVVAQQEFPEVQSREQLQSIAADVIRNNPPEPLRRGRTLFYDTSSNTFVIVNTRQPDRSTIYRPRSDADRQRVLGDKLEDK